jgi:RNA polymerase sigma factor (sigma-70 family)
LIRLAVVMLGDRAAAEDVVQEAFCGLYRRWNQLSDTDKALSYVRSSVINGCRSALRKRRLPSGLRWEPASESAESAVLISEEHQEVLAAMRRLPARQREAVVLRFYLDRGEEEIAASWSPGHQIHYVSGAGALGGCSGAGMNARDARGGTDMNSIEDRIATATRGARAVCRAASRR